MICPYCQREMEVGVIQSPHEIAWLKGEKRRLFGNPEFHKGSVVLSRLSLLKGSAVRAYLCRDCRKVIVDCAEDRSDLNRG